MGIRENDETVTEVRKEWKEIEEDLDERKIEK